METVLNKEGVKIGKFQVRQLMKEEGLKAHCYDNAQAESFFSRFKVELIEGGDFENIEEARSEIFSYIEGYYNLSQITFKFGKP